MNEQQHWRDLFLDAGEKTSLSMRAIQKHGRTFLLLPKHRRLAASALSLYPAQTLIARAGKSFLRSALQLHIPFVSAKSALTISRADPFVKWLSTLANAENVPDFAILVGNPSTPGQRFVMLLFHSTNEQPIAVVKCGTTEKARELIASEEKFLKSAVKISSGIPQIRSSYEDQNRRAIAINYLEGNSPKPTQFAQMFSLLNLWLDESSAISMEQTQTWQRLTRLAAFQKLTKFKPRLEKLRFHPAIFHGDFAPWNIKVSGEKWTALDWERGELLGIPGWDAFHFVTQTAILVEHLEISKLIDRMENFFREIAFKNYAERARIGGFERELFLSYLLYQLEVIQPTEGRSITENLFETLSTKWSAT
jgi:hypothetical protein